VSGDFMVINAKHSKISDDFFRFMNEEVLPLSTLDQQKFWGDFETLISDLPPKNPIRNRFQPQINDWHNHHQDPRWVSLYNVLYGTNVIPQTAGLKISKNNNPARVKRVIAYAKDFLDEVFPLYSGSHHDVASYQVYYQHLHVFLPDGCSSGLRDSTQFVAYSGSKSDPAAIVLKKNDLHMELQIDRSGTTGINDLSGMDDIVIEASQTAIMEYDYSLRL